MTMRDVRDILQLLVCRPVIGAAILFIIAAVFATAGFPLTCMAFMGLGVGFFAGFVWGYCRGMFAGTRMDHDYRC